MAKDNTAHNAACRKYYQANKLKCKKAVYKWNAANYARKLANQRQFYKENPELFKSSRRKTVYGLSDFDYNRMSDEQGFSCAICKEGLDDPTTGKRQTLHVDHCHRTDKNRGLLCSHCNTALGLFHESLGRMRAAMQYLLDKG